MPPYTLRKTPATAQGFTEPLDGLGEAIPLDMLLIPAGSFMMGSPENEPQRESREGPQHQVSVPSFFMGRYPVTQAQWRVVAGLGQVNRELKPDPSNFKGDNRPVEQVSWYEAVEFCDRFSRHTGRPYRLPSEAEWEYACRAGTKTPFTFGKTLSPEVANYRATSTNNNGLTGKMREETTPVNYFDAANAFGLVDMHGNAYEWCQDPYRSNYANAPEDDSAGLSENEGAIRVLRGGSRNSLPGNCRSAYRFFTFSNNRNDGIGFRIVCSAP
jgi:formylglycine-generating enzyme required for sulfatase activity